MSKPKFFVITQSVATGRRGFAAMAAQTRSEATVEQLGTVKFLGRPVITRKELERLRDQASALLS